MKKMISSILMVLSLVILVGCQGNATELEKPTLKDVDRSVEIDVYTALFGQFKLSDYFNSNDYEDFEFELSESQGKLTFSSVSDDTSFVIYSNGDLGTYTAKVKILSDGILLLEFNLTVNVVDGSPDPVLLDDIEDMTINAPVFLDGTTLIEQKLKLSDYFEATQTTVFNVEAPNGVTYVIEEDVLTLTFNSFGEFDITVIAAKNGVAVVSSTATFTVVEHIAKQLINGDFENGWSGWKLDAWAKNAYALYDSEFDIWGNNVGSSGTYLYGYHNESGTAEIESSLFTAGGTGLITFKLAGNSTEDLQVKLMKHNSEGEDEVVATFNNWYFGKYGQSGFIFRHYWYMLDLNTYRDAQLYFVIIDNKTENFGFINIDSIVTYYETNPSLETFYEAGFIEDPAGQPLDFSDTSQLPFTSLENVGYQLANGDFEKGYSNWFMSVAAKEAYAIYDNPVDIWSNPVNSTRSYLYGFQKEDAMLEFHSDLFKVGGTGLITFKLAGNSTEDLQFKLMKYNPDGDDEVVATFNNWYFSIPNESGFIFRNYWYMIDLDLYQDDYMYFEISDMKTTNFGFVNVDDIVTYYESIPTLEGTWFKAGFVSQPDGWDTLPSNQ